MERVPKNNQNHQVIKKQPENCNFKSSKFVLLPICELGKLNSGEIGGGHDELDERESEEVELMSENCVDEIVTRLEELYVGNEEVELSEELLKINDQAQKDELLAMESIYGDNVYVLETQQGLKSFQVHIHIELPSQYIISAKSKASTHCNSNSDSSHESSYTFKVEYLSPIELTCLLSRTYPSHCQPLFIISVQWLPAYEISKLCFMLDSLWAEQPGQEILYQWVEWLQSSSLSYLGFDVELVLGSHSISSESDRRALSGIISPDADISSVKNYDEERRHENFLSGFHECSICFSTYPGTEFLSLPCQHFFCAKCMMSYAEIHVKEGTVHKLICPNIKCNGMIPPGLLKQVLDKEKFERWELLMLQKSLDTMADVVYCPRCETACLEDEGNHAQCSKCFFSFCTLCREPRHVGIGCMTPEMKLKLLQERQSSQLNARQKHKEQNLINHLLSVREIFQDAKLCPSCKVVISRTEGCDHMTCRHCGEHFCFRCGKSYGSNSHSSDTCKPFEQDMMQLWEAKLSNRQLIGQSAAQQFAASTKPCPSCRQLNAKTGNNNHIFCWACQNHYCYLCGKIVRNSSQHYGPKGCKQHSVDH